MAQFLLKKMFSRFKPVLKTLIYKHFSHISSRALVTNTELEELQCRLLNGDSIDVDIGETRKRADFCFKLKVCSFRKPSVTT
ncbi:hypothetical protein F511_28457 [Dorcoceras hygrometricum]|uniref:Uncharacterized protein n=1 Tax=Dorcoceras hygrometricum TaxID=472368 RepID=A0A2Z7B1Z6_9LAMI|nr:hypothetical protein F511_28457 [Dorcoceras hygrometricum]